jgi:hypothetical protein
VQAREAQTGIEHLERSLEIGESIGARYEIALTLKALADVGAADAPARRARSESLFRELGVVSVPSPPLP